MDQQAATLLSLLKRTGAPSEAKINQLNALKSDIKHCRVPEAAQAPIFECLRISISQTASSTLASAGFSTLTHMLKRLRIQDTDGHAVTQLAPRLLSALQDRLGDPREQHRQSASQALGELYPLLPTSIENIIRDEAIPSSNSRAKETAMRWVVQVHQHEGMPFKSYVGPIVSNLEDADPGVREAAKQSIVDLFSHAPDRAKADLKKQLKARSVRHGIETQVLAAIAGPAWSSRSQAEFPTALPATDSQTASVKPLSSLDRVAHQHDTPNSGEVRHIPPEEIVMDPICIDSTRELEGILQEMLPHFQGREDEGNWVLRDKSVLKIRRILKGNAPGQFLAAFLSGLNGLMEGILKVANSLRTTVSSNGCQLVQELAKVLGSAIDKHVEILLQSFIKMSAATKPIAAVNGRSTCEAIFQHVSYNVRLMQHVHASAQDKNAQTRQCSAIWLQTILKREAPFKTRFETSGGLDLAVKCIDKGLNDANPKVKERSRACFWDFSQHWPDKADQIANKLDAKSRSLLEKDAHNPNTAWGGSSVDSSRPAAVPLGSRTSLREQIAAQRQAKMAAHKLPSRPNSAMAELSPARPKVATGPNSQQVSSSQVKVSQKSDLRVVPLSLTDQPSSASTDAPPARTGSSLMSGPVRRPRRPEPVRPQTADPYSSVRLLKRPETPSSRSPQASPKKHTNVGKSSITSSSDSRSRPTTAGTIPSSHGSPIKFTPEGDTARPGRRNSKHSESVVQEDTSGPTDDFTLVLASQSLHGPLRGPEGALGAKMESGSFEMDDSDALTMVVPSLNGTIDDRRCVQLRPGSSGSATSSPLKQMFAEARRLASDEYMRPGSSRSTHLYEQGASLGDTGLENLNKAGPVRKLGSQSAEMQIYEDPFTAETDHQTRGDERQVLGELPVNETVGDVESPTPSVTSSNSTGTPDRGNGLPSSARAIQTTPSHERAEFARNCRLLASGIERIQARTLDAHGFRRMQDVAKCDDGIWGDGRFDDLMGVLLDYVQSFESDARLAQQPMARTMGLRAQALGLVKALLKLHQKNAQVWYARALLALMVVVQGIENSSHLVTDVELAAEELVRVAPVDECLDALLDFLPVPVDGAANAETRGSRSKTMALITLRDLVAIAKGRGAVVQAHRRKRLARVITAYLDDADAEARKASVDLGAELFDAVGEDKKEFWEEFKGIDEGRLGLLTYYTARKARN